MKHIIGLGNPDKNLANSRHNAGFMFVDYLASLLEENIRWRESKKGKLIYLWVESNGQKIELVKPLTYMNNSGLAVAYLKKKHSKIRENDLYVIHDDMDIELGKYKIQYAKGPKLHGGINSIEKHLRTKNFWRLRIGIGAEITGGEDYVLDKFNKKERQILDKIINKASKELLEKIHASQ